MVNLRRKNIKKTIKYFIGSKTNKNKPIETLAKITKNKITYQEENTTVTVINKENQIEIIRENLEFKQIIQFNVNKKTISEYYIKDMNVSLEFHIITKILKKANKYIYIEYLVEETNEEYNYELSYKEEQ